MRYFLLLLVTFLFVSCLDTSVIKKDSLQVGNATVSISSDGIVANTGKVVREWNFTSKGVKTIGFRTTNGNVDILRVSQNQDFSIPQIDGELPVLTKTVLENDKSLGVNIPFITLALDYEYPKSNIGVRYIISTFPDAPGIKSQLFFKRLHSGDVSHFDNCIVEELNLEKKDTLYAVGYFQKLALTESSKASILREESFVEGTSVEWANFVFAQEENGGAIFVKEAPHSVDNTTFAAGKFELSSNNSLQITSSELQTESLETSYKPCWATWSILYEGAKFEREYALKYFDRIRYPINRQRDVIIASDVTGSYLQNDDERRYKQRENNIALELKASRNIGIDLVNIGAGWNRKNDSIWYPVDTVAYDGYSKIGERLTSYVAYSDDWKKIRKDADKYGLKVGLWTPSNIPYENLKWNQAKGNFRWFRFGDDQITSVDSLISLNSKVKAFIKEQGDFLGVNMDLSRNNSGLGFFYGRDYGNIRLESLAQDQAIGNAESPWMLLRNVWYLSKYTNLNQYQIPVTSNQFLKSPEDRKSTKMLYQIALSFMGTPLFYQEVQNFDPIAQRSIKEFVSTYKKIRNDFYKGIVFPIGDEPSNKSWTGFHNYYAGSRRGYFCMFREVKNTQSKKKVCLQGVSEGRVKLTNIVTGSSEMVNATAEGIIEIEIKSAGDFKFIRYEKIDI